MRESRPAAVRQISPAQRDFCEGGSLAVPGGEAAAIAISDLIESAGGAYDLVVATRDWHVGPRTRAL